MPPTEKIVSINVMNAARPFFADDDLLLAPPDERRGTRGKAPDRLAWYADASLGR
jgi:hypothetical protein